MINRRYKGAQQRYHSPKLPHHPAPKPAVLRTCSPPLVSAQEQSNRCNVSHPTIFYLLSFVKPSHARAYCAWSSPASSSCNGRELRAAYMCRYADLYCGDCGSTRTLRHIGQDTLFLCVLQVSNYVQISFSVYCERVYLPIDRCKTLQKYARRKAARQPLLPQRLAHVQQNNLSRKCHKSEMYPLAVRLRVILVDSS